MSTMRCQIAFYKGPPHDDWAHTLSHYGIRVWTWSRWSHAELVIDGVCHSSSARDGGVRSKVIDLASGRWDVVDIDLPTQVVVAALLWFQVHDGEGYDYLNVGRFVLPLLGQDRNRWVCFESIGAALGLAGAHKLTANDLHTWAMERWASGPAPASTTPYIPPGVDPDDH